jgi:hypothetical protein
MAVHSSVRVGQYIAATAVRTQQLTYKALTRYSVLEDSSSLTTTLRTSRADHINLLVRPQQQQQQQQQ